MNDIFIMFYIYNSKFSRIYRSVSEIGVSDTRVFLKPTVPSPAIPNHRSYSVDRAVYGTNLEAGFYVTWRVYVSKRRIGCSMCTFSLCWYVQELGCAPTGKETIAQLQRLGMTRLYLTTVPDGSDPVGFGKGANLRYDEIQMDKQYCQWVRTQYKEHLEDPQGTSCCPQLVRLAMWLEQEATGRKCSPEPEAGVKVKISEPELKATPKVKMEKGYASGSGSPSPHSIEVGILGEVMATLKELKTEVQELKDERPRRQRIGNTTESDFSMVSTSPKHQT